jgi:hypothetical protein
MIKFFFFKVEFCSKEFTSKQKNKFTFQFWDIGGKAFLSIYSILILKS